MSLEVEVSLSSYNNHKLTSVHNCWLGSGSDPIIMKLQEKSNCFLTVFHFNRSLLIGQQKTLEINLRTFRGVAKLFIIHPPKQFLVCFSGLSLGQCSDIFQIYCSLFRKTAARASTLKAESEKRLIVIFSQLSPLSITLRHYRFIDPLFLVFCKIVKHRYFDITGRGQGGIRILALDNCCGIVDNSIMII